MVKNRDFFYWRVTGALFWVKNIKVPFVIGHPHPHIKPSLYMWCAEGFRVPNLQTELKYLDPFKSYCIFSNCKWPPPWRHPCLSCLTCMCMCVCMHACMHMCACMGHSIYRHPPTPPSTHPIYPQGGVTPQIS